MNEKPEKGRTVDVYTSAYGTRYVLRIDLIFSQEEQIAMAEEALVKDSE